MKKISDNFCGYLKVDDDIYTYNVSTNIVTLLPAQSDRGNRHEAIEHIRSHNTDFPEYLFGEDENGMIAMLCKGKFVTSFLGINTTVKFATPIIVKACGNANGFFSMMTEDWNKFHAITFYGGNVNALYNLDFAIEFSEIDECLKNDGAREIKIRPWKDYSRSTDFKIDDENVNLTFSIGQLVNCISIRNVQDMCTALEVSYHLDAERKKEKDVLIEELKKNIKKTIAEFVKAHNEIDVYKETTISSAFQYLDYTLKQKILTLYNENCKVVAEVVLKNFLPQVNEDSIARFVNLRNRKTHSGTVEWGENAKIYKALMAIVYSNF